MKLLKLLSISLVFCFISCKTTKSTTNSSSTTTKTKMNDLINTSWRLIYDTKAQKESTITLDFQAGGKLGSFDSCNEHLGTYITSGTNSIKIEFTTTSMKYCMGNEDKDYNNLISKVTKYQVKSKDLYLYQDNLLLLHFIKK